MVSKFTNAMLCSFDSKDIKWLSIKHRWCFYFGKENFFFLKSNFALIKSLMKFEYPILYFRSLVVIIMCNYNIFHSIKFKFSSVINEKNTYSALSACLDVCIRLDKIR